MGRYLLDTCVLVWLLKEGDRVKELAEDINYYQGDYAVSIVSIAELLYLAQSGKLKIDISFNELIKLLKSKQISALEGNVKTMEFLSELPFYKKHTDPLDRLIIAQAIADDRILITGDMKFKLYKKLQLIAV